MDVAWHPFIETMLITGDDAGIIKVSKLPGEFKEWPDEVTEPLVTLEGHAKKVGILQPNPVANNILISTSYDQTVRIWDIEAQSEVLKYDLTNDGAENITPMHVEWNRNGSLAVVPTREGKFKLYDPRDSKLSKLELVSVPKRRALSTLPTTTASLLVLAQARAQLVK
jgi:WD40 repeat protein